MCAGIGKGIGHEKAQQAQKGKGNLAARERRKRIGDGVAYRVLCGEEAAGE